MTSGELPLERYHRASSIGEGSFGSVVTVYNDKGEEYALKVFAKEEEMEAIDLGALREISCLRLLRGQNRHDNIIALIDVQGSSAYVDEGDECGAGTGGGLGMALPLFPAGSVASALNEKRFMGLPRREKIVFAHGLLSAVAFLHDQAIVHRDIKSDNVLLKFDENGGCQPVLIDFSLAKPTNVTIFQSKDEEAKDSSFSIQMEAFRHTGEVGTVTYTAPEIFNDDADDGYGLPVDLWSVGVVLLEIWQNSLLEAQKNSHALKQIETTLSKLPEKPFPDVLRNLLQVDPTDRWTARQGLQANAFTKFNLSEPPIRKIDVSSSLPVDYPEDDIAHQTNPSNDAKRKAIKRRQLVEKLCNELGGAKNPMTLPAALDYASQMEQLDDELDDLGQSTALLDCVVLAFRFWEREALDLEDLSEHSQGPFADWNLTDYIDNEATLFLMLDYCLYPRTLR